MNESRLPDYLEHIRQAAADACSFVEGQSKKDFLADRRTQQAVILSLLVIGEAATKLLQSYGDFLTGHPDVPWSSMKGMRNRLAHGYFDITAGTHQASSIDVAEAEHEYRVTPLTAKPQANTYDAIILAVAHPEFLQLGACEQHGTWPSSSCIVKHR